MSALFTNLSIMLEAHELDLSVIIDVVSYENLCKLCRELWRGHKLQACRKAAVMKSGFVTEVFIYCCCCL
jgi:hypothetical protein